MSFVSKEIFEDKVFLTPSMYPQSVKYVTDA